MTTANDAAAAPPATPQEVLDGLFRGPRERFVAERNAAAKRAKQEGRPEQAAELLALTKPSVSAWTVNQLWWTRRERVQTLLDAGHRLALCIAAGAGPAEQAAALQARRHAVDELLAAATELLASAGHGASMATMRRIGTTLEALSVYGAREGGPHPGRLCDDLDPPGFEALGALAVAMPPRASESSATPSEPAEDRAVAAARAELARAELAHGVARDEAVAAARTLDGAMRRADEHRLARDHATDAATTARARAEEARRAAEAAEAMAHRARVAAERADQALAEAHQQAQRQQAKLREADQALAAARERLAATRPGESPDKPR